MQTPEHPRFSATRDMHDQYTDALEAEAAAWLSYQAAAGKPAEIQHPLACAYHLARRRLQAALAALAQERAGSEQPVTAQGAARHRGVVNG